MKLRIPGHGLIAVLLALGLVAGGTLPGAAPAGAQETSEPSPWYMPPAWVHPPRTGPYVRKLPGYYGHTYRNRTYGGFSNYCYGVCRDRLPGTVTTGYGVTLSRPVVAIFDPRAYEIVPRALYEAPQAAESGGAGRPAQPAVVPVGVASKPAQEPLPKFSMQNGVRIIRPSPVAPY